MDEVFGQALERFSELWERAQGLSGEPAAVTLATVDGEGRPAARVVLLRGFDERGFVFYTNSHSRKGRHLAENPLAALCFYWEPLGSQVRVEGRVERIADDESDAYWATRPRDSQLGAWASDQSAPLDAYQTLVDRLAELERRFAGQEVPRPTHWHGFRVVPHLIEFWQRRPARLHERIAYEQDESGWTTRRLCP